MGQPISILHDPPERTREQWEQLLGGQPPPFDPAQAVKSWALEIPDGKTESDSFDYDTVIEGEYVQHSLSWGQVASLNCPGPYRYPALPEGFEPTSAVTVNGPVSVLYGAENLSSLDQAHAIAGELGRPVEQYIPPGIAWGVEPRRAYTVAGRFVSILWRERHSRGIGAPGKWMYKTEDGLKDWNVKVVGAGSTPQWHSLPQITQPLPGYRTIPPPCRRLMEGEEIRLVDKGFGGFKAWEVVTAGETAAPVGGGGFTDADRAMLDMNNRLLIAIASLFRVGGQ